ncbi:endogenous retrovirus group K member 10 Gag polyprotein-like [Fukomys damarensis]|uniref:endogenous retrovirus group K member 10 Gag polyprotein-like n=1 Tax=Fukomys damarensis TaxID=885580 RepID=UPI00053F9816|nr:endogenous retrovirus group K member 10 Gag polyprotein-like [Fukomys damarensis]
MRANPSDRTLERKALATLVEGRIAPLSVAGESCTPLQRCLRRALEAGEDVPKELFPIIEVQGPQGPQQEHRPLEFKLIKELKLAVNQYGTNAPFTTVIFESLSGQWLALGDWKAICKAALSGGDYLLWWTYTEKCKEMAHRNRQAGMAIATYDMLSGEGLYDNLQAQAQYVPAVYDQVANCARQAWRQLPSSGDLSNSLSNIRQGPDEPYSEFVHRLLDGASRIFPDAQTGLPFVTQLAYENANKWCKPVLRPWKAKTDLNGYIRLCADVGNNVIVAWAQASAREAVRSGGNFASYIQGMQQGYRKGKNKGHTVGAKAKGTICYNCRQEGHIQRQCPLLTAAPPPSGSIGKLLAMYSLLQGPT